MEDFIQNLVRMDPIWVYIFVCAVAYVENIFPPFPSDIAVVAVGSLAGMGRIDFSVALLLSSAGSTVGFITMYKVGDWFGQKILERGKIKFIPLDQVHKVEGWFQKYGYWIVIGNRFLSGTRAVVSFFAGLAELSLMWCVVLSFLSALTWNFILLYAGRMLGQNWKDITIFLEAYGKAATSILVIVLLVFVGRYIYRRQFKNNGPPSTPPPPSRP